MPRESELLDPLAHWFRTRFGPGNLLLIHEEPQGKGGRRPDILVVVARPGHESVKDVTFFPVEIENSSRGAIHDRRNGLAQLRKYSGHAKYLAIPTTVASHSAARDIPRRCEDQGVGFLSVDLETSEVACIVQPVYGTPARELTTYPVTTRRWIALRESRDTYRRIAGRVIIERG